MLLVRPSALGDVARTVPALATLRRAMPEARIDWLVAEAFADSVRHHPMLDGVVTFARDRLARFGRSPAATREGLALARRLRRARYDVVVDLQGLFRSGLFTWLTRSPRRVGFADARELAWLGYTVRHAIDPAVRHTVDRMLALLQAEGHEPVADMRLYVGDEDRAWLDRLRERRGIGDHDYACLAPTARWGCKCWPLRHYTEIARRLLETGLAGDHLVVLASPAEQAQVEPMLTALRDEGLGDRVHRLRTSVGQLMALLNGARLLVCNDSAPLHIAVGFDRPIVAIYGPTDPAEVGPYRRDDAVVRPPIAEHELRGYRHHSDDATLISRVGVDEVWEAIGRQLHAGVPRKGEAETGRDQKQADPLGPARSWRVGGS